ncbi:MAG: hypothetical protein KGZ94_07680 [Clostridia bacterium]|nr:hypothetical protein [Clostridia bacterium]
MKQIGWAAFGTVIIFFISLIVIAPIISKLGYSAVEGSYHAATHALLVSLIFTVIICTVLVLEEIKILKEKYGDKNSGDA